jgi:hypothetical protein
MSSSDFLTNKDIALVTTTASIASSVTHVQVNEKSEARSTVHPVPQGHGESALPEDKSEEELENLEDDWENDPDNPRNWPSGKKWRAVCIVRAARSVIIFLY